MGVPCALPCPDGLRLFLPAPFTGALLHDAVSWLTFYLHHSLDRLTPDHYGYGTYAFLPKLPTLLIIFCLNKL
jgi:hypothetical protein